MEITETFVYLAEVAVTGTNGKTTTSRMIRAILGKGGSGRAWASSR
jgi:UDP-N-acetylmuramoylalanine-D-glutamate ligase